MKEVFRDIENYEGLYQVSNLGRVKSLARNRNNQYNNMVIMLKFQEDKDGYLRVSLKKNSIKSMRTIHRLVAEVFILNLDNKLQINHKNGIKSDNRVCNLEWCTCKENINHAFDVLGYTVKKGINQGEKSGMSKLVEKQVLEIRKSNLVQRELAKVYNVSHTQIGRIKNSISWSYV